MNVAITEPRNQNSQQVSQVTKPIFSLSEEMNYEYKNFVDEIFSDFRLKKINPKKYENFTMTVVDIILNGESTQLQALAEKLTIKICLNRPSLIHLKNSKEIPESKIVLILGLLIHDLSRFFDTKPSNAAKGLAWLIFKEYGYFSLEDFILFFQKCKKLAFANDYQHISSRGINAEFLQIWLKEYDQLRENNRDEFTREYRSVLPSIDTKINDSISIVIENIDKKIQLKLLRKAKIRELKIEHDKKEKEKSWRQKLIEYLAFEVLFFEVSNYTKSTAELITLSKVRGKCLVEDWKKEFKKSFKPPPTKKLNENWEEEITTDNFIEGFNAKGDFIRERMPALTLERFLEMKTNQILKQTSKTNSLSSTDILREGLNQLISEKKMRSNFELFACIYLNHQYQSGHKETLIELRNRIIRNVDQSIIQQFILHETDSLNNHAPPLPKKKFCQRMAWQWICTHCFSKIKNPKNIFA